LQRAVIAGNDVAGLVLNGSADVTIRDSNFTDNIRQVWSGAALVAAGQSRLRVERTYFVGNIVESWGKTAGV
jgi:hypothetical protein